MILQNSVRSFVSGVLIIISPSNTLLFPAIYYQDCQAVLAVMSYSPIVPL